MTLSILIPAYNEEKTLHLILDKVAAVKLVNDIEKEIIIVNDCSSDDTEGAIKRYMEAHPELSISYYAHEVNKGKGAALHTGFAYFLSQVNFEYVVNFDGDGQHRVSDANKMVNTIKKNNLSAVLGSRFIKNNYYSKIPFFKIAFLWFLVPYPK